MMYTGGRVNSFRAFAKGPPEELFLGETNPNIGREISLGSALMPRKPP
jgi:hypothetical protein